MGKTYHKYFIIFLPVLMFLLPVSPGAMDFGLLVNQYAGADNHDDENTAFDYKADILPRLSFLAGDSGEVLISAGFTLGVVDKDFYYVPELLCTEFLWRSGNAGIRAGRIQYTDPLTFIADGLFDGARFSYDSSAGSFSAGVWYTGLLYKKTANITMTAGDQASYDADLDYSDLSNTYFAPKRFLASLDWEHPSVGELLGLKAAVTGQIDLTGEDVKYNSQYLTLKAGVPVKSFLFELGGSFETAEFEPADADDNNFNIAFAWDVGIFWTLPTSFNSRLSLTGHFAGGAKDGIVGAFVPITTKYYGDIFKPKLSGLSVLALNYTARLVNALGTSFTVSHFVRNDLGTFNGYPIAEDNKGYSLGTEFFVRLIWSPVSDLQLNLGAGVFSPAMGNAGPDANARWRVELAAILALF